MGLFSKKPMYKYQPLEKVRIDIDAVNSAFLATNPKLSSYEAKEFCELIGETNNYRVYVYQRKVSGFDGYFLRQEKSNPKKVAYLGSARKHCCVFHDKLFTIDSFSPTHRVYHPLICKDINTGVQTEMKVLSDKGFREFIGNSMHLYCQDVVHSLGVHNDVMTLEVYRYPADSLLTKETYHEECIYLIHIRFTGGKFTIERVFPKNEENTLKKPFWRDDSGKVACPGDDCPLECDDSCPIWLNTKGLSMLQINQFDKAVAHFNAALALAPDFLDVQNNLGTAYGMNNQHQEAYEAFKKAHEMKKDYPKALNGLIVAEMNLGLFEDARRHCDELEAIPGCDASGLREKLESKEGKTAQNSSTYNYMDIAAELLAIGRKEGQVVSDGLPFIPEILNMCVETCLKLFEEIQEYGKTDPKANTLRLSLAWSAFAGMGAVYHWHTDWNTLSQNGLFETLTKERGVYEMDEYVLDIIGIQHDDFHGKMTSHFIMELANKCISILEEKFDAPSLDALVEAAKAMFMYGMVFEMNRLGMK